MTTLQRSAMNLPPSSIARHIIATSKFPVTSFCKATTSNTLSKDEIIQLVDDKHNESLKQMEDLIARLVKVMTTLPPFPPVNLTTAVGPGKRGTLANPDPVILTKKGIKGN
ncbi:hypothetical protein GJ496_011075 [Pomphorhynchus laevis]|nr:hypothetical protein GJ496_011075 [Pomphorhynchus laevis]